MLFLLVGCIETKLNPPDESPDVSIPAPGEMAIVWEPQVVDFGLVGLGAQSSQTLTITNVGEHEVFLTGTTLSGGDLGMVVSEYAVAPGEEVYAQLYWTPTATGEMGESLTLMAGTALSTQEEVPVPVVGESEGAEIEVSLANHDYGQMLVGCSVGIPFSVTNVGNVELIVADATLSYGEEYYLSGPNDGELPAFPWRLEPGASQDLTLTYAPELDRPSGTTLTVFSNDPLAPEVDVIANGAAVLEGENLDQFVVSGDQAITMVFAVNQIAKYEEPYRDSFGSALPSLFETLQSMELDYRVAFVGVESGDPAGDLQYLDHTLSPEASAAAAQVMLENMENKEDNDTLFLTLDNALAYGVGWLLEDDDWAASKLGVVGINNNLDQSEGGFEGWVDSYRSYKEESEDVLVHAIGGPMPDGCEDKALKSEAEAMLAFNDAAAATGGLFFSVCEGNWAPAMEAMAAAMEGERSTTVFELTQNPAVDTIEVWADGVLIHDGWTYNSTTNAIIFDDDELPEAGTALDVSYVLGSCTD